MKLSCGNIHGFHFIRIDHIHTNCGWFVVYVETDSCYSHLIRRDCQFDSLVETGGGAVVLDKGVVDLDMGLSDTWLDHILNSV